MSNEIVWKIKYYELSNDKKPFLEGLEKIRDRTDCAKIIKSINRMAFGNFGDSEPVGDGVSELRLHYGPGYRVYYARVDEATILILYVGRKSTQSGDIKYAKRYLSQYKKDRRG